MKKLIHLIAAARPNFMKIAPLYHALKKQTWAEPVVVHTGQHYDINMSDAFFKDLRLPEPHVHLGIGSGSHAEQAGRVMMAYEQLLNEARPDMVIVVGDVNSTMACTLAAVKISYLPSAASVRQPPSSNQSGRRPVVAHLEAGLRSFDRTMPEEINRLVTDSLADLLWTPSEDGDENLLREGVAREKIERVGNIMIDSLEMMRPRIKNEKASFKYGLKNGSYGLVTLHRPANVDPPQTLKVLCEALIRIAAKIPLIFPIHPRTRKNLEANGLMDSLKTAKGLFLDAPLSYLPFMNLVFNCRFALTDSGGIQEETTYLGKPCLTLRPNTERPITISQGTNRLIKIDDIENEVEALLAGGKTKRQVPDLWDGHTAGRVLVSIRRALF